MKMLPAKPIRAIFLDAGFTLLHPKSSLPLMCQSLCAEHGLRVNLDQVHHAVELATEFYYRYNQRYCPWEQDETIQVMWIDYYKQLFSLFLAHRDSSLFDQLAQQLYHTRELPASWQSYPDALPVLRALKECGCIVGVISDWGYSLGDILKQHGFLPYLDCLIISAHIHCAKPSPAIFESALRQTQTRPDEAIYIGDSYLHDIIGARTAQITPILLDRSQALKTRCMDCQVIPSLHALLEGGSIEALRTRPLRSMPETGR